MIEVTVDLETFWSTEFSLSKMSFIEYCRSPEFEIISCSVQIGDGEADCTFGHDEVGERLRQIDWSDAVMIAHNGNEFDFPAIWWAYRIKPKLYVDTLCMARPKHQSDVGGSLKKLSDFYNLPEKDNTALMNTKGKRLADFTEEEKAAMAVYNAQDVRNTYALYKLLLPDTPPMELHAMDMTVRMIVDPKFVADRELLEAALVQVKRRKVKSLMKLQDTLGVDSLDQVETVLASNNKFADVLRGYGVEPPMKISKKTKKPALALAKDDRGFQDLLEHDDPDVQALCAARMGVKSTQLETRIEKLLMVDNLCVEGLPIPLAYHSATTGRWGGRIFNPQNLPRISRNKDGSVVPKLTNALRMALKAPLGYKVVVSDLSGIELRVNHYLWQVKATMDAYAADPEADLYRQFASEHLYNKPPEEVDKAERQLAKVSQLGLGFGAGSETFKRVAKTMGGVVLSIEEAEHVKTVWRTAYVDIVRGWKSCQLGIEAMLNGESMVLDPLGLCETGPGWVRLPSGRKLYYPDLRQEWDDDDQKWNTVYGTGRNKSRIYGPLFDENLVQAIARDVITQQALHIYKLTGKLPALKVHDELVYVVPESQATQHLDTVLRIMRKPVKWLPGLVLWSEGDIADRYGLAK